MRCFFVARIITIYSNIAIPGARFCDRVAPRFARPRAQTAAPSGRATQARGA